MKYSNFLSEKEFPCGVEKIGNDNLTGREKKHDMVLNLGLGTKGTTFTDQTPTPTQFIRNCEEVGLFQDLQNENPFEETFRKAAEAAKAGQTLPLNKSYQSNQTDDTLHTPKVFPHITDVPNRRDDCMRPDNFPSCDDSLLKQDITESGKTCKADITDHAIQQHSVLNQKESENAVPLGSIVSPENKSPSENKVILNVPDYQFVQLIPVENPPSSSCKMVFVRNSSNDIFPPLPLTVKEKLKKSLKEKKVRKVLPAKVPILKCPPRKVTQSDMFSNFSNFSKNAFKLQSRSEKEDRVITSSDVRTRIHRNRSDKQQSKESRSEFLARSRAAAYRCREKKKKYVLYLETVNKELSTANENLQLINMALMREIGDLHAELTKHKNCNAADENTETALTRAEDIMNEEIFLVEEDSSEPELGSTEQTPDSELSPKSLEPDGDSQACESNEEHEMANQNLKLEDPDSFTFDVAEITLEDKTEESEIPLNEGNKPPDIIVRFNSVGNYFPAILPFHSHLDGYTEHGGEKAKRIYKEHSYFLKKPTIDVDKRLVNYKTLKETSEECKKLESFRIHPKKSKTFADISALDTKALVGQRTPPPLILLKPFKKRTVQDKQIDKT